MAGQLLALYFSGPMLRAISHTLFYSIEIGFLVAVLAGLVILLTKKASASTRYRLLCSLLVLFTILTLFTFYKELEWPTTPVIGTIIPVGKAAVFHAAATVHSFGLSVTTYPLNSWSGWIVALWIICCLFKGIKLTRELLYVKRVRTVGIRPITGNWNIKVDLYKEKLGIGRAITLLESELVKVPVTLGHLRPIILLPVGIILQLSREQIESIIWHELAHIARRDYLVGILQSILETLFFFNPAIWWLSTLIREEREACCDDIVLAHVTHKRPYLEALVAFQNAGGVSGGLAIGLSSGRNRLLDRLKRIVNQENHKLNTVEKIVLFCSLIFLCIFIFVPAFSSGVGKETEQAKTKIATILTLACQPEAMIPVRIKQKITVSSVPTHSRITVTAHTPDTAIPKTVARTLTKNGQFSSASMITKAALFGAEPEPKFKPERTGDHTAEEDIAISKQRIRGVIAALIAAKIVNQSNDIEWFGLSDTELIVNDQKQSFELQQQLKERYGVGPRNGLYYGPVKMTGMGVFFDKKEL